MPAAVWKATRAALFRRRRGKRAPRIRGARGGSTDQSGSSLSSESLIDILLPVGQRALQRDDDVRMPRREIGAFARVVAEIEQQVLAAIDQQLPATGPDGLLLAIGAFDAPEEPAFDHRGVTPQEGQQVDPIG